MKNNNTAASRMSVRTFVRVGVLALLLAFAALLTGCGAKGEPDPSVPANKIDLTEYLHVSVTGYDTLGEAYLSVDDAGLAEALFGKQPDTQSGREKWLENYRELQNAVRVSVSPEYDLSNGDVVSVLVTVDADYDRLNSEELFYPVSGLTALRPVRLADYTVSSYTGYDGYGTASFRLDMPDGALKKLSYEFRTDLENGTLSNGDELHVTMTYNGSGSFGKLRDQAAAAGLLIEESTTADFTVSGLPAVTEMHYSDFADWSVNGVNGKAELNLGGSVRVNTEDGWWYEDFDILFDADKTKGLSNGDTVTLTMSLGANYDYCRRKLLEEGKTLPESETLEIPVEGLRTLYTSADQVSDKAVEALIQEHIRDFNAKGDEIYGVWYVDFSDTPCVMKTGDADVESQNVYNALIVLSHDEEYSFTDNAHESCFFNLSTDTAGNEVWYKRRPSDIETYRQPYSNLSPRKLSLKDAVDFFFGSGYSEKTHILLRDTFRVPN